MSKYALYVKHISVVLGCKNDSQIRKVFDDAYECYQDTTYACAYLEKKYKNILTEYRAGEPAQFINKMPPFKPKLSKKTIARVIEMREAQRASFVIIAEKLHITKEKARETYDMFYHKKVLDLIGILQEKAESIAGKRAIWDYYFKGYKSSKRRYDVMTKDNPVLSTEYRHITPREVTKNSL